MTASLTEASQSQTAPGARMSSTSSSRVRRATLTPRSWAQKLEVSLLPSAHLVADVLLPCCLSPACEFRPTNVRGCLSCPDLCFLQIPTSSSLLTPSLCSAGADAMRFTGAVPEIANSRLAMLGVIAAVAAELGSGMNVFQQVQTAPVPIALTFLTLAVATIVPVLRGVPRRGNGFWSADAEVINGRYDLPESPRGSPEKKPDLLLLYHQWQAAYCYKEQCCLSVLRNFPACAQTTPGLHLTDECLCLQCRHDGVCRPCGQHLLHWTLLPTALGWAGLAGSPM